MNGNNICLFINYCFKEQMEIIITEVVKREWYETLCFCLHLYYIFHVLLLDIFQLCGNDLLHLSPQGETRKTNKTHYH